MTQGCGCCRAGAVHTDGPIQRYFLLPASVARSVNHTCSFQSTAPGCGRQLGHAPFWCDKALSANPARVARVSAVSFLKQNIGDFMVSHAMKGKTRGGQ